MAPIGLPKGAAPAGGITAQQKAQLKELVELSER